MFPHFLVLGLWIFNTQPSARFLQFLIGVGVLISELIGVIVVS